MSPLSKEEILAQLEKIGIHSTSEAEFYLNDYEQYTAMPDMKAFSPKVYQEEGKRHYHSQDSGLNRMYRACYYVAPKIARTLNSLKTKALKRNRH